MPCAPIILSIRPTDRGNAGFQATHTHKLEGRAGAKHFCWWVASDCWHHRCFRWSACLFLSPSPTHGEKYGRKKVPDWQTGTGTEVRGFTELYREERACFRWTPLCLNVIMCEASHSDSWTINYIKNKNNSNFRIADTACLITSLIPNLYLRRSWYTSTQE